MCELTLSTDNVKRVSLQNLMRVQRIIWSFREKSLLLIDFKYIYFLSRWIYLKIEVRCSDLGVTYENQRVAGTDIPPLKTAMGA